ncbi:MAG TPA: hypothetical protein VM050_01985, partial [Patescibacteria group bacterium]|nr:hypothetical protein [Patescibacteria group bacterium]
LVDSVRELLQGIQSNLAERSRRRLEEALVDAYDLDELKEAMDERRIVRVNWCGDPDCAFQIKDQVAGEVRGTLWEGGKEPDGPCIICGDKSKFVAYVSRTY